MSRRLLDAMQADMAAEESTSISAGISVFATAILHQLSSLFCFTILTPSRVSIGEECQSMSSEDHENVLP
jgi:hypothetical protein